jgi:heptosyltransferase I
MSSIPCRLWLISRNFIPKLKSTGWWRRAWLHSLKGHPLLHRVHRLGFKRWRRQGLIVLLRGVLEMVRTLRRQHYDVVLDLQGNCKSGLFTLLCKAPLRYGFARNGVREWPNLLATNRKVILGEAADHHISARSLAVAREAFPGSGNPPLAGPLVVDPGAADRVSRQLRQAGF